MVNSLGTEFSESDGLRFISKHVNKNLVSDQFRSGLKRLDEFLTN